MALVASLVASVASTVFAVRLAGRWRAGGRRNPALLAWTISLGLFAVASLMLLAGVVLGWSSFSFHVFYLFGAVLTVPWLALGSVLINARDATTTRIVGGVAGVTALFFVGSALDGSPLAIPGLVLGLLWAAVQFAGHRDRVRVGSTLLVLAFTVIATVAVLAADLTGPLATEGLPEGRELFGETARGFAVGGNAIGSIVVIVGALVATARMGWQATPDGARAQAAAALRERRLTDGLAAGVLGGWRSLEGAGTKNLVVGNLLIALGTVLAASSGGMFSFLGDTAAHAVGIGLGVLVMERGFQRTARPVGAARADAGSPR